MIEHKPQPINLRDYRPPSYLVDSVDLRFNLGEEETVVAARLALRRNPAASAQARPCLLDGVDLELRSVAIDGKPLAPEDYVVDARSLRLLRVPEQFVLDLVTVIRPQENTSLEGLYKSSGNFCTQCEAEGFRKITYYPDRPDVMARFTTTIVADKALYPVLLSNGNLEAAGDIGGDRHFARWHDPFPKPAYLFALVAGNLASIEDVFTTGSGKRVALKIFVQEKNRHQCDHAMASLKQAMAWDEQVYGLEYDLDTFMIVAVDDFNMGAMENKGLNVFNSSAVLARPETATDADFQRIAEIVAHEYFHNWTGNRITCRDWFQLSLKEGLTVFRDQQFSADMVAGPVARIHTVRDLRARQFAEDAGPLAHPVRPESYIEINNFYTATVYNKGAEVVRMLHTLLGPAAFRAGMDLYVARHDGQAVTTEDFVAAMEDASGKDLAQFRRWYSQAGTPELAVTIASDPGAATCTLFIRQILPPTPGQPTKEPLHIPVAIGMLAEDGRDLPLRLADEQSGPMTTRVLELRQSDERFTFTGIPGQVVPSLLRGFSAPVKINFDYSDDELLFLWANDSDPFSKWNAGEELAVRLLKCLIDDFQAGRPLTVSPSYTAAFGRVLVDPGLDPEFAAATLTLPSESYLAELVAEIDVVAIHAAREHVRCTLAAELAGPLQRRYEELHDSGPYSHDRLAVGRRSLKNLCLAYLMAPDQPAVRQMAMGQLTAAENMTDMIAALHLLANSGGKEREAALARFYSRWQDEHTVINKWLAVQATSKLPGTLGRVQELMGHPAFSSKNPNRVRALIGSFCFNNPLHFHDASGAGYEFLAAQVLELDRINPQIAARMLGAFGRWRKHEPRRRELMAAQLGRIVKASGLSKAVYEVAAKSLG